MIMKKAIMLLFSFSLLCSHAFAQKIGGYVLSAKDSLSLPGATVRLMDVDSTFISGTSAGSDGAFAVDCKNKSNAVLVISSIGYSSRQIMIEGIKKGMSIGEIYLQEDNVNLDEVVVKANNKTERVDKSIVFPSIHQLKVSNSALSLLQNLNLSGLNIDAVEQKININGAEPVYMVNGIVKSKHEFLTVNPKDIKRIEYADSPSIRYLDKGAGGVINLVLKNKNDGGSFWGNALGSPMTGFLNTDVYFSYNKAKSEYSINYFNNWRDYKHRWTNKEERFIAPGNTIERKFVGVNSPFGYFSQGLYFGYTYQYDINTMFSVAFRNDFGKQHTSINGDVSDSSKDLAYFRESKSTFNSYRPELDLFFSKKMKNNQTLEVNVVGTFQDASYDRALVDKMLNHNNEINNPIDNSYKSVISEILYKKNFKKVGLNFGFQNTLGTTNNTYHNDSSNKETLRENNNYVYGNLFGKMNKFSYSIGSGLKVLSVNNLMNKRLFVKNQSMLSLMYSVNDHLNLKMSSFYTPQLPALSQLSDVTQVYDEMMIIKGNPQLKAAHTIGSKLFINYDKGKLNLSLTSGYKRQMNSIYMDVAHYKDKVFISQYKNATDNTCVNIEAKSSLTAILNHINLYATVGYNYFTSKGSDFNHHLGNLYWDVSAQVYWDKWTFSAYYVKPKKSLNNQILDFGDNNSQVSLGYKYKNLDLFAAVKFPFERNGWHWSEKNLSGINPGRTEVYIKDNRQMLLLGLTYSFNFGKGLQKSNKKLSNTSSSTSTSILKVQE